MRRLSKIAFIACLGMLLLGGTASARSAYSTYKKQDSVKIVTLLKEASRLKTKPKIWMLYFGKKFLGVPYVAGTLDAAKDERLVINTTQLDCTTYVEMVVALTRCAES